MFDSLRPMGCNLRLLHPWGFPGKNSGVCCHFLLQGIFLTQGSNQPLLHWQADSLPLNHSEAHYSIHSVMTNLESIFKSRDITLPTKVRIVKAMVFPVVMYGCESWNVKKAEHQRIGAQHQSLLEKCKSKPQ